MTSLIRPALSLLGLFSLITGLFYPLLVTGIAQLAFRERAGGSLLVQEGQVVGSALIGQPFSAPQYFWGRPSATSPGPYNAAASSGSNQGPSSAALADAVATRSAALRAGDPAQRGPIPVDLVTASASGLDPHVSPAAALYQVQRVAKARGLPAQRVRALVAKYTEPRDLAILGEARVNVLSLNRALDALSKPGS